MERAKMPVLLIQEQVAELHPQVAPDFPWTRPSLLQAWPVWRERELEQAWAWVLAWALEQVQVGVGVGVQPAPPSVYP
jgi:hypothetical protein